MINSEEYSDVILCYHEAHERLEYKSLCLIALTTNSSFLISFMEKKVKRGLIGAQALACMGRKKMQAKACAPKNRVFIFNCTGKA